MTITIITNKLSSGNERWAYISPEFTDELVQEWKNANFDYDSCKEWMNIVKPSRVAVEIHNAELYQWLAETKNLTPEEVLNYGNIPSLLKEYEEHILSSSSSSSLSSNPKPIIKTVKQEEKSVILNSETLMPLDWEKPAIKTLNEWETEKIITDEEKNKLLELANKDTKYTLEQLKQIWKQSKRQEKEKSFIDYNYFVIPTSYYNRNQTEFPLIKSAEDEPIGNSTYAIYNK